MIYYVDCDGEMVSRKEYCRRKGLNYSTVQQRMKTHNETFEQAVYYYGENGINPYHMQLIKYDDEFISAKEYCRRIGLSYRAVCSRVKKHNETYEQAINYYIKNGVELRRQRGIIKDRRFYNIWRGMVDRCINPKNSDFEKYSKLGIQDSWLDFENFQDDMYEEYLECLNSLNDLPSIDRIKNNLGYFKENCHWIPKSKQVRNQDRNLWANEDELLIDYCERKGLRYDIIISRLHRGYTLEEAESMPIPKYTGKYLEYIGKNIREFNILKLKDTRPSCAIARCNICGAEIEFKLDSMLNNNTNKGCFCRKGYKYYIGNNNYTIKELETLYNYSHEEMKKVINSGDMSLFNNIVNLTNEEWIELLKGIHSKW